MICWFNRIKEAQYGQAVRLHTPVKPHTSSETMDGGSVSYRARAIETPRCEDGIRETCESQIPLNHVHMEGHCDSGDRLMRSDS